MLGRHLRTPYWDPSTELYEEGSMAVCFYSAASRMPALTPSASERVSRSVLSPSRRPHGLKPTRFLCPWGSPGKNTGVGSHSPLQGIFLTKGLNLGLPHCRQILDHVSHQGIVSVLKPFGKFLFVCLFVCFQFLYCFCLISSLYGGIQGKCIRRGRGWNGFVHTHP